MASTIAEIPAAKNLTTLLVESSVDERSPVVLFLHGKGEASPYRNELPKVEFHFSPPFRAAMGSLRGAIVVAPQAPHAPDEAWNWRTYAQPIGEFLKKHFGERRVLAAGFSRGGLGVLQVMAAHPGLVTKWAIVDPQRAGDDEEHRRVMHTVARETGWLRYANAIPTNTPFSQGIAAALLPENSRFVEMGHGDLALAAFAGDPLGGPTNLYQFLGLEYVAG